MKETKSVGIWIRVSTEDQARGESPEHHEKRARYYAESKGWTIIEVYHLEAVSGKSVMDHSETKRMLADLRSHRITGLIFSKLARLARNTKELLDFSEIFRECDADLISLQEAIDTSTPAGRLFYTMIAAMAQWEREEISDRVAASVPIRAKLGKPLGGAAPFGYRWVDKKLVLDPKEAPIRKRMYELFLEHRRKMPVAEQLNKAGYRTRSGSQFDHRRIDRLLRDPIAKGVRRANYTRKIDGDKKVVLKPQADWVLTEVDAIVSEEVWNRCNAILDEQDKRYKHPARPAVNLFSGYAFCSCGSKMYVPSNSPKYVCRACRTKIGVDDLEAIFQEQLRSFVFSESEIVAHLEGADQLIKDKEALLGTLTKDKESLKLEMEKIYRLYLADQIPVNSFGEKYKPLDERVQQIDDEIPKVQAEIDFLKIQYLSSNEIITEARDLYSRWSTLEAQQKRNIIETITDRIIIGKSEVTINLSYLPKLPEMMAKSGQTPPGFCCTLNTPSTPHRKVDPKTHAWRGLCG